VLLFCLSHVFTYTSGAGSNGAHERTHCKSEAAHRSSSQGIHMVVLMLVR